MLNGIIEGVSIDIIYIVIVVGVIFISMTLHEVMHGLVGYWLGDTTAKDQKRLSLNPIRHIDPFLTIILPLTLALIGAPIFGGAKPVPFNPANLKWGEWGTALVAVAGPITNLLLAFIGYGVWVLSGAPVVGIWSLIITTFVTVNLGFFIFNMLPLPPLDGSRVLYALAPDFVRRGMEFIERFGLLVILILVLIASPLIGTIIRGGIDAFLTVFQYIFV